MRAIKELRGALGESGGERGVVLVTALLVMLVLLPLGAAFLTISLTETTVASNEVNAARGFSIAEAGIELARSQLLYTPWHAAFGNFGAGKGKGGFPGLIKEYSTALGVADANVADWSTTAPSILANATRIRWTGLTLAGGAYTVMGASVDENGVDLDADQVRVLATGYVPNSAAPKAVRTIEALVFEYANFLEYGFSSTGAVFCDEIDFFSQPGGRNDSYNGGPGVFKPSLTTGYYAGGNVPVGGAWSSVKPFSTPLTFPPLDFARYASSPDVVNLNAFRDVNGVVTLTQPDITPNTVYYVDGSIFIQALGVNPAVSFIATHDIKINPGQGLTAVPGYPLFAAGGFIYMDTDNALPLTGLIYSDGSHALPADRTYPIDPAWVGHGPLGTSGESDLVYVESASNIIGAVAARIPPGSGLRLFGGGGATVTYDMNLLDGLQSLYLDQSGSPSGGKYLSWREK